MKREIKNYEKIEIEGDHSCDGCCFYTDGSECYLLEHIALNDALLARDGECYNFMSIRVAFIYKEKPVSR